MSFNRCANSMLAVVVLMLLAGCPPAKYALNVALTGEGGVAANPAAGPYDAGSVVTLTATAAAGWHFDHWSGALTGNANPVQVAMNAAKSVTAVFMQDQYALTLSFEGQGSVGLNPQGGTYLSGSVVTLTAAAAAGWHFDHWSGALTGNANPAQVTMDAAKSVTADFARDQYALAAVVEGGGRVVLTPPGGVYDPGTLVTVTPEAAAGWHFDHWDGALTGGAYPAQVAMDAGKLLTAVFVRERYTLNVAATGPGSVGLNPPGGTYDSGTVVTLTPNPAAGNRFEVWGGRLTGIKNPATITMSENTYVDVFFMPTTYAFFTPNNFCAVGSTLYFLANGPYSGQELWKTDGTYEGTKLVKDILPLQGSPGILFLKELNGMLYFFAPADGDYWLWKSDGTEEGTIKVASLGDSSPALPPLGMGGKLYFSGVSTQNGELWVTDGTAAGTRVVKSFGPSTGMLASNPGNLTDVGGVLYFNNEPQTDTFTLWKSDGTEAGTVPIHSARWLSEIAGLNGHALFRSGSRTNDALFTTDGTPEGTHALRTFDRGGAYLTVSGGLLYFSAEHEWVSRVWATNGSAVYLVDTFSYNPGSLTDLNGTLLYEAIYDVESQPRRGLFAATGSGSGLLREIEQVAPVYHAVVGDTLFFTAGNSNGGTGIWKSDGTSAGTVLVSDINPVPIGVAPYELTAMNGALYFSAADEAHGHQVWKSDGTTQGTFPISCPIP